MAKAQEHKEQAKLGRFSALSQKMILKNLDIPEKAAVLDIGCGNGDLLAKLSDDFDFYGTGLDSSEEVIELAKEKHPAFNFFTGSAEQLPFPDNAFDVMICSTSFHHFSDTSRFLQEAKRVLRPEGSLAIGEIRIPLYDLRKAYNNRLKKKSDDADVKVYGQKELEELFVEAGFYVNDQKNSLQIQYFELIEL